MAYYFRGRSFTDEDFDVPVFNPQFSNNGRVTFFEAYVKGTTIASGNNDGDKKIMPLVLKTTDMSAEDWTKMIATIASVAGTGGGVWWTIWSCNWRSRRCCGILLEKTNDKWILFVR